MNDLEILFVFSVIVIAFVAAILMPVSRQAHLLMIDIFAIIVGAVVAAMGFLAFTTHWSESGAWQSGVLMASGGMIVYYMMTRWTRHGPPTG